MFVVFIKIEKKQHSLGILLFLIVIRVYQIWNPQFLFWMWKQWIRAKMPCLWHLQTTPRLSGNCEKSYFEHFLIISLNFQYNNISVIWNVLPIVSNTHLEDYYLCQGVTLFWPVVSLFDEREQNISLLIDRFIYF